MSVCFHDWGMIGVLGEGGCGKGILPSHGANGRDFFGSKLEY